MIGERVWNFLTIPRNIEQEFYSSSLRKNKTSLAIVSVIIYITEIFNIFRVLFMSRSGLSSFNNRMYFYMYLMLMVITSVYLTLQHLSRERSIV